MTRDEWKERLPLIQAFMDGAEIETEMLSGWGTATSPSFTAPTHQYRIKPKPKDIWVNEYNYDGGYAVHDTPEGAKKAFGGKGRVAVHYREVLEDE